MMPFKIAILVFLALWLFPLGAPAAQGQNGPTGELSVMGSYSKTNLGSNTYTTTKRYTGTLGVNLTAMTEIELSYAYTDTFLNNDPIQTSSINEQSLGLSLVQSLVPQQFIVQPYVKGGVAQYNRKQSGTTSGIPNPSTQSKSPSGILGGGLRIFLLRNFSLKAEAVTYLPDMHISEAKNNFAVQVGLGWNF